MARIHEKIFFDRQLLFGARSNMKRQTNFDPDENDYFVEYDENKSVAVIIVSSSNFFSVSTSGQDSLLGAC